MTTNYSALGEYTAYSRQAKDAASRRYALLHNLSFFLGRLSEQPEEAVDTARIAADTEEIAKADREMRAALERANQAAALAGEVPMHIRQLAR